MNKYIKNFYDLYSLDNRVFYQAVLEKKDWMFRKLFFPCSFSSSIVDGKEIYNDLFALMDQCIEFKKANFDEILFDKHDSKYSKVINAFNEKFRIRYCYEKITQLEDKLTFWVEMDFQKIDKKLYNDIVANFYPCINNVDDLDLFYDESNDIDLLKYPMYGQDGQWVFILDKTNLIKNRVFMPFIVKIYYNPNNFSDEQISSLREIASNIDVKLEEYYD